MKLLLKKLLESTRSESFEWHIVFRGYFSEISVTNRQTFKALRLTAFHMRSSDIYLPYFTNTTYNTTIYIWISCVYGHITLKLCFLFNQ